MNQKYILQKMKRALKKGNTTNLFKLAEENNIIVLEYELGDIYGFYTYLKKNRVILLNSQLSDLHKKMVLSHEIGHALLHTKVNCAFIRSQTKLNHKIYEKEANFFGANLLKAIGYLYEQDFCIHASELEQKDMGFLNELLDLE